MKMLVLAMAAVIMSCNVTAAQAQQKVLYSFGSFEGDGVAPASKLLSDASGNLFGTTLTGGRGPAACFYGTCGIVFELKPKPDGTWEEVVLYYFCSNYNGTQCLDGGTPEGGLVMDSAGNLYGTTYTGGTQYCPSNLHGCGTIFELSPNHSRPSGEWTYAVLYNFCTDGDICPDGAFPQAKLTLDTLGNLYGTTNQGGVHGQGAVFKLSPGPKGWTESVVYSFCSVGTPPRCPDGWGPKAAVALDKAGNIYGTTSGGGSDKFPGAGVVYRLAPDGSSWKEKVLFTFLNGENGGFPMGAVNFDAAGNLYSTASSGGEFSAGIVFRLSAKNGGSERAFSFNGSDGAVPMAGVLIDPRNGNLYGTTSMGGTNNAGTVYKIVGKKEGVLYSFTGGTDGATPLSALIADKKGHLYGTTKSGGAFGKGVVFEIIP